MRSIAKPIKNNKTLKVFAGITWQEIMTSSIIIVLFSAIWIPLFVNKEIPIGIGVLIASILLSGVFLLKIGEFRISSFIYNFIRFRFTKIKNARIDFVEKSSNNTIYLKDDNKSIYEYYRIIGKDISLLNENDVLYLCNELGYFFKENNNIHLLKIDGKINLNKITDYINSLNVNQYLLDEKKENIKIIEKLKENYITSNQPKYFIAFSKKENENISDLINSTKDLLNQAELDLISVTEDEIEDIKEKLYFDDITVVENSKSLFIHFNKTRELSKEELETYNNIKNNEYFYFRNNYYYRAIDENNNIYWNVALLDKFNDNDNASTPWEWKKCENPFDKLIPKDKYITFIAIKSLPSLVNSGWLYTLFNEKGIDVNFKIINCDIKNLERDLTRVIIGCEERLEKLSNSNLVKYRKAEEELNGYQELTDALANGQEIKNVSCLIKLEADNQKELSKNVIKFVKKLRREGFEFTRLQFKQFDALKSFFANESIGVKVNPIECVDNILGYGYPFVQQEIIDNKGLYFGKDQNQTPTFIDWKKMNQFKNSSSMILLGKTGSGKTTTIKRIIKNQMMSNEYKIFVIDPENEYGDMFVKYGGEKIRLNDPNYVINPFNLNIGFKVNEDEWTEAIKNKMLFLDTFYHMIFDNKLSPAQIEWLIQKTNELYFYNKNKKELIFSDVYKWISKFVNKQNDIYFVLEQLGYYCHCVNGNKAYLWDHETTINMNNDYIVFEFGELLSKSGTSVVGKAQIFIVLQYLNDIVLQNRKENHKYINIVVDEAHLLIDEKYLQVVSFMTEMYKRIRKYHGMMTLITQNIGDFYKPAIVQYSTALINNAFFILLHTIKDTEIDAINELMKEQGGLKEAEKEFLKSDHPGQCLLMFNKTRTKIQVQK